MINIVSWKERTPGKANKGFIDLQKYGNCMTRFAHYNRLERKFSD